MSFDVTNAAQSALIEDRTKASLYYKLHEASKKTGWIRLTGLGVGIVSGLLTIAKRIALIAECIFKGLINILGACCIERCKISKGLLQLLILAPLNVLILPFSIFSAALGLIDKPVRILFNPVPYTQALWLKHEREVRAMDDPQENRQIHKEVLERQKNIFNVFGLKDIANLLGENDPEIVQQG